MEREANPDSTRDGGGVNRNQHCAMTSMWKGGVGFSIVSVIAFSIWAVAGRWLLGHFGEIGLFTACLVAFLGSAGLLLFRLVSGSNRLVRFYKVFVPAFLAYSVVWCAAWFGFRFGLGEWLGSLFGSLAFVGVTGWGFGRYHGFVKASAVLFICHSAGYFLGGEFMRRIGGVASVIDISKSTLGVIGELGWGAIYGGGFGAGIGYVFHSFQIDRNMSSDTTSSVP